MPPGGLTGAGFMQEGWRALINGDAVVAGLAFSGSAVSLGAALLAGSPPLLGAGLALAAGGGAALRARRARLSAEKASQELDVVAARLVALEAGASAPASSPSLALEPSPQLKANLAELTAEIALLGGLVRDLAVTVAAQDRELRDLREAAMSPQPAERAPAPSPPPSRAALMAPTPAEKPLFAPPPRAAPPLAAAREEPDQAEARREAAVREAFEQDRLELHLQPVVSLPQRKAQAYEMSARLRLADGAMLTPAEFGPVIERLGLAAELDRRVVARAALVARHLASRGSEATVSCDLSPRALQEPGFLRSLARLLESYPDCAGRLVLELSQRCWRTLDAERAGALATLRERGVLFALDRAVDLRLDPLALADRGVRLLKLPADLLLRPGAARSLDIRIGDLSAALARAGIRLVAEAVEREEDVPDLIDLEVPLSQGAVFAPPRPVRPEVFSGKPAPAEAPARGRAPAPAEPSAASPGAPPSDATARDAQAPDVPAPEQRMPFRAFLRRAG